MTGIPLVVLDACVLANFSVCDTLLRLAEPPRLFELMEATVPQLQAALTAGTITSKDLVTAYLARIDAYDHRGPALTAISWRCA